MPKDADMRPCGRIYNIHEVLRMKCWSAWLVSQSTSVSNYVEGRSEEHKDAWLLSLWGSRLLEALPGPLF
jgi:hypothetical protein